MKHTQVVIVYKFKSGRRCLASVVLDPVECVMQEGVTSRWGLESAAAKPRRSVDGPTWVVGDSPSTTAAGGLEFGTTQRRDRGDPTRSCALGAAVRLLHEHGVCAPGPDRLLSPEIEIAVELVASGAVLSAVEAEIGELT